MARGTTTGLAEPYRPGDPTFDAQPVLGARNLGQLTLAVLVALPSLSVVALGFGAMGGTGESGVGAWQRLVVQHPIAALNVVFFFGVCVLFWLVSLVQRSCWLIDLYWTIVPLLSFAFFALHPTASFDPVRSALVGVALAVWSGRLTWNYLRRERFRFGAREDWRFAVKRRDMPGFWWFSFFYAFVSQQALLMGLVLPLWAIHNDAAPFGVVDTVLIGLMLAAVATAHVADSDLHRFMEGNRARVARGEAKVPILERGLWRLSRHPNYFGEQLFWWALAGFGLWLGEPWVLVGPLVNSIVMAVVTKLTEERMLADEGRADLYRAYQQRTSMWIPWPRPRRS